MLCYLSKYYFEPGTPCDLSDPSVTVAWQWMCDSCDVVCQFCCIKSKSGRASPAEDHAAQTSL